MQSHHELPRATKDFTRYPTVPLNTIVCATWDHRWSHNHCQICPAKGEKCNNCGIIGHFAKKMLRTQKATAQIDATSTNESQPN